MGLYFLSGFEPLPGFDPPPPSDDFDSADFDLEEELSEEDESDLLVSEDFLSASAAFLYESLR